SSLIRPPPRPTLFPYTTLFRSGLAVEVVRRVARQFEGEIAPAVEVERAPGVHVVHVPLPLLADRQPAFALGVFQAIDDAAPVAGDRKSTRLNSSHVEISYAVFC